MHLAAGIAKLLFLVMAVVIVLLGAAQIILGLGYLVPIPNLTVLDLLEFGAGRLPSGLALLIVGMGLFVAVSFWKQGLVEETTVTNADGSATKTVRRSLYSRDPKRS
jgi:hypothetical protein